MYREIPDKGISDSGWRFLKRDENEEYLNNPNNFNFFDINTICNMDKDIIEYLNAPVGSKFIRINEKQFEEDNQEKEIYFQKQ